MAAKLIYVSKRQKRNKLEISTKPSIMLRHCENSTQPRVLDFASADIIMALSTSTYVTKSFSGILEDILKTFILKLDGELFVEDGDYVTDTNCFENLWKSSELNKTLLTSSETTPNSITEAS